MGLEQPWEKAHFRASDAHFSTVLAHDGPMHNLKKIGTFGAIAQSSLCF
jgi:hypothetical protein